MVRWHQRAQESQQWLQGPSQKPIRSLNGHKRGSPRHTLPLPPASASGHSCPESLLYLPRRPPGLRVFPGVIWSGFEGSALIPPCTQRELTGSQTGLLHPLTLLTFVPTLGQREKWQSLLTVGRIPTPSLSQASPPTHRNEFWDTEQSPRVFLNVLCFWTENNFADVLFGLKKREREFQAKHRMI